MTFEIIGKEYDEASACWHLAFRADATAYEPIGFGATIPVSGWREQVDGDGENAFHSFWGTVTLHSRGVESDRLLGLLAKEYGIPAPQETRGFLQRILKKKSDGIDQGWIFANSIECFAVGINSNPSLINNEVVHMKLFLEDGVENGRFAEVFFNVDMDQGFAALNEKDQEYRADLVHWLSLPGNVNANPY
ncbi:hypothetical protein [Novosphingobium sp. 9]|uniref:hypothetical protein n=1 Tax=Novosphingobium sp. 9 TaxID=2025349 RepID=UPI0021B61C0A|nr:hypothetical protein [Novosphingobium sp. 9]